MQVCTSKQAIREYKISQVLVVYFGLIGSVDYASQPETASTPHTQRVFSANVEDGTPLSTLRYLRDNSTVPYYH